MSTGLVFVSSSALTKDQHFFTAALGVLKSKTIALLPRPFCYSDIVSKMTFHGVPDPKKWSTPALLELASLLSIQKLQ